VGTAFTHMVFAAMVVWRGFLLARAPVTQVKLQLSFQVGLLLLLFYGISNAPAHPAEATVGLYLYLFWALIGMSAVRISSLSTERSGRMPRMSPGWLLGILLTALSLVALAILSGWFASQRVVAWILSGIALIFAALAAVLLTILIPLFTILARLISGLIEFLRRLFERFFSFGIPTALLKLAEQLAQVFSKVIPANFGSRAIVIVAILIFIAITIFLAIRFNAYRRLVEEEENSQVGSGKISLGLGKMIRRMFPNGLNLRLRTPGQLLAAARIRFIYRRLIALSQKRGIERHPAITPLEFLPRLSTLFPAQQDEVELITHAYVRIRYGEYPETLDEVNQVQRAWNTIRSYK
jgi:hypothetical protein